MRKCYDFKELVIHDPGCPRYKGGVCRPYPTPKPPYNEEEAVVIEFYYNLIGGTIPEGTIVGLKKTDAPASQVRPEREN